MYWKASIIVVVFTTYVVPLAVIIFCYAFILKTLWQNRMASGVSKHCDVSGGIRYQELSSILRTPHFFNSINSA